MDVSEWMGLDDMGFVALVVDEILGGMWYGHLDWGTKREGSVQLKRSQASVLRCLLVNERKPDLPRGCVVCVIPILIRT
jgi:hypothetical protein